MVEQTDDTGKRVRNLWMLASVNVGVWAAAVIAFVFLVDRSPSVQQLFPILAGGTVVSIVLLYAVRKFRNTETQHKSTEG